MEKNTRIYLERNPNPNSLKFVVNYLLVKEDEIFDYPGPEHAGNSPLALMLFEHDYVERVFIMNNFITITKNESVTWDEVQESMRKVILEFLESNNPVVLYDEISTDRIQDENESEIETRIRTLLDEYVKPAVEQDGGAISFHSYKNGIVKVLLQGACSGCPSSTITLKNGIENLLKAIIPEIKAVEAEGI